MLGPKTNWFVSSIFFENKKIFFDKWWYLVHVFHKKFLHILIFEYLVTPVHICTIYNFFFVLTIIFKIFLYVFKKIIIAPDQKH